MASSSQQRAVWHLASLLSLSLFVMPGRTAAQGPIPVQTRDAVLRAMTYFNDPDLRLEVDGALIHAYLQDRFGLPVLCQAPSVLEMIKSDPSNPWNTFMAIAEPIRFDPNFLKPPMRAGDEVTLCGMWYDELPDKRLLTERIKASDLDKPYYVTHALWAMAVAKHCFQAELDTALERRLVRMNMDIMTLNRPQWNDVAIEALAFAQYHDPLFVPPAEYIKEIISLQNPDGSWNAIVREPRSASQHTTILALWALLQYKPLAWPQQPRPMVLR